MRMHYRQEAVAMGSSLSRYLMLSMCCLGLVWVGLSVEAEAQPSTRPSSVVRLNTVVNKQKAANKQAANKKQAAGTKQAAGNKQVDVRAPVLRRSRRLFRRYRRVLRPSSFQRYARNHRVMGANLDKMDCRTYIRRTGQPYCVELVTMGLGKWLFTFFGHNGLRVVTRRGRDVVYNFGTFDMGKPMQLVWNYLHFRLRYRLSVISERTSRYIYRVTDRTYRSRRLLLTPDETRKLVMHLREHNLPKNRYYNYHHYFNNCSTKVRDALRKVLGEEFYKRAQVKRGASFRKDVMEHMKANPVVAVLMDFGMGPPADRPTRWWDEMFLPTRLESYLLDPYWAKKRGRPLVGPERIGYKRKGPMPRPFSPATFWWIVALAWLLLAMVLYPKTALRWYLRIVLFVFGMLGLCLLFMMVVTKFPEPPGNANIVWFHPLHLVMWWWIGRKRWMRATAKRREWIRWYFTAHAGAAVLYLLLKLVSVVPFQQNTHYVVFALFVFGIGALRLSREGDWGTPEDATEEADTNQPNEAKEEAADQAGEATSQAA